MDKKRLMELAGLTEMAQGRVTVAHAIQAYNKALQQLQRLDPNLPIEVTFDQGGYTGDPIEPRHIVFHVGEESGTAYLTIEV